MHAIDILPRRGPCRVLCIGAHSDDIEIGAGGTILGWLAGGAHLEVEWCIGSASDAREAEARDAATAFLEGAARVDLAFGGLRDGYFPADYAKAKAWIEGIAGKSPPDLILTHRREDAHQDHRIISELTYCAFRDHVILEYEIPKWDGDLGQPNVYAPLSDTMLERKIGLLGQHFASQRSKDWYDQETFRAIARLRGVECRAAYAEAFWARKLVLAGPTAEAGG